MTERAIVFGCAGEELLGILHDNVREMHPPHESLAILIVVGGPQYRVGSHRQFVRMARMLGAVGYPVFRFDYRGMGDSSGVTQAFEQVGPDLSSALDTMFRELPGLQSACVLGLCDAASAALMFAAPDPRVTSLVLVNPWVRTDAGKAKAIVKHYYGQRIFQRTFWAKLLSGNLDPVGAIHRMLGHWQQSRTAAPVKGGFIRRMLEGLTAFQGPVLLLLSGRDLTAQEFGDLCRTDPSWRAATEAGSVRVRTLAETDHTFSDEEGLMAATAAIREFLDDIKKK